MLFKKMTACENIDKFSIHHGLHVGAVLESDVHMNPLATCSLSIGIRHRICLRSQMQKLRGALAMNTRVITLSKGSSGFNRLVNFSLASRAE